MKVKTLLLDDEVAVQSHFKEVFFEKIREIETTREAVVNGMAILAEHRDDDTGLHIQRVKAFCKLLAETVSFPTVLSVESVHSIALCSVLHDIGKVGIPDSILKKPGKLDSNEFEIMKEHTLIGAKIISQTCQLIENDDFLQTAVEIIEGHHEKWDGTGYPYGLIGSAIPLSARIMAIADVYDALTSKRVYKSAFSHEQAVRIIKEGAGKHFDPHLVECFTELEDKFSIISGRDVELPDFGIEVIDNQHKLLMQLHQELVVDLLKIISTRRKMEKLYSSLKKLIASSEEHFRCEEQLMKQYSYPGMNEHIMAHKDIVHRMKVLLEDCVKGNEKAIDEALYFVKYWIIRHVGEVDVEFVKFIMVNN